MKMSFPCLLVGLLFLVSCNDGPATPSTEPAPGIVGQVLDVDGNPAVGAPVGVILGVPPYGIWDWPPEEFGRDEDCLPSHYPIGFGVEEASAVTLQMLDHRDMILRTVLVNELLPAGHHEILWDGNDDNGNPLPNGAYKFKLTIRRPWFLDEIEGGFILINPLSLDYTDCVGPAAVTDAEGRFRIPYETLPLGHEVGCGWEETCTIPDSLWIQSTQGIGRVRQALRLDDLDSDHEITLQMDYLPD